MKTTSAEIERFFSAGAYAVIGVSENRKKFGNIVYRTMKEKQFVVYPVNPHIDVVEEDVCYSSVAGVPGEVKSVITVVPPAITEKVVGECIKKGITGIWIQPGSQSNGAIEQAARAGISVIHNECILMFLEPVESFHALHRWLKKIFWAYPK
jgi:uncharacterized protein